MPMDTWDLAVVGGGSGGFGTALAAARRGLRVLLVEPGPMLGGTSTLGGVNTWEPGVGNPIATELYEHLARTPAAIGVSRTDRFWSADQPWGLSRIDRALAYGATERRAGLDATLWARATFEPAAMAAAMAGLLTDTGRVEIRLGTRFVAAGAEGDRVAGLVLEAGGRQERVAARFVADATAQIHVCTALGCRTALGTEARSTHGEPSAPEQPRNQVNGVTICFRVTPVTTPAVEPLPAGVPDRDLPGTFSITEYPCGDLNLNMLPMMQGWEFHCLGPAEGRRVCLERLHQAWRWLQREKGFDRYRLATIFPLTGVREGPRLVGRAVLTENDVRRGRSGAKGEDRWVALADHALDVHGEGHLCRELGEPYGIPYECLLPREFTNLIVPCRGASFSHIAAASCRLSRTMIALGQAAGIAVAEAVAAGTELAAVEPGRIREGSVTAHA